MHEWYGLGIGCNPLDLGVDHHGAITGDLTLARNGPASDVSIVVQATMFDVDGVYGQADLLIAAAREAPMVLGY